MDTKKKNVSLRLSPADLDKVRQIAERIGVRETDIFRFAIKQMLVKLAPFKEESYKGVDLMPAMMEVGEDMIRFFDLGTEELNEIINQGLDDPDRLVADDDLRLLAMSGINGEYARMKLNSDSPILVDEEESLKAYFMKKYFSRKGNASDNDSQGFDERKTAREWSPFQSKPGTRLSIPKTA